jgi:hypothetical protein
MNICTDRQIWRSQYLSRNMFVLAAIVIPYGCEPPHSGARIGCRTIVQVLYCIYTVQQLSRNYCRRHCSHQFSRNLLGIDFNLLKMIDLLCCRCCFPPPPCPETTPPPTKREGGMQNYQFGGGGDGGGAADEGCSPF